jgi:hypothetical protein
MADKGFSSVDWECRWLNTYKALVAATPQTNVRRTWSEQPCRWAAGKRQLIEGVIWQLKDYFGLERHRTKTLGGLLNSRLGRPLRGFANLLPDSLHSSGLRPLLCNCSDRC